MCPVSQVTTGIFSWLMSICKLDKHIGKLHIKIVTVFVSTKFMYLIGVHALNV